jgi:hypothetical protein
MPVIKLQSAFVHKFLNQQLIVVRQQIDLMQNSYGSLQSTQCTQKMNAKAGFENNQRNGKPWNS